MGRLGLSKTACVGFLFYAAKAISLPAQTFKTLVNFDQTNGRLAVASLVQGTDGNQYGTTAEGGANGVGTVFKVSATGKLATLYSFCSQTNCTDGSAPYAGLSLGTDGNFYGTTIGGGDHSTGGTVFKITSTGALTTLYSFCAQTNCTDGDEPDAGLIQATNGNFYGTTVSGGANGAGTVFKITLAGRLTTLHSFCAQTNCTDGFGPAAALVQTSKGEFYGTTVLGGAYGEGTIFKITAAGNLTTLYSFCVRGYPCADGSNPSAGLVQAPNREFYGTAFGGGANNFGTVFKITASGTLTTLYSFCGEPKCADGDNPASALVRATDGNFYGTTSAAVIRGGQNGDGTVFKITAAGTLTTLHSFSGTDGDGPVGGLVQATNGNFYGTTPIGGADQDGTLFGVYVKLRPFVQTQPTSGKVATKVIILGTDLRSATGVSFHGTPATFKVVSKSEIKTTVPKGATTGAVEVTTPKGTLKSNVVFRVMK
jgi:uncharacterized repeat protein (TIGR03803 family)